MNLRKAFTMLELVFVIVMVGILSAMIAPNFQKNSVREAADQIISHIRYTQHLAMMDDKYNPADSAWYKGRWQLSFSHNAGSDYMWAYTIFSDWKGTHSGNPDAGEVAANPINKNQFLTGGTSGTNIIHYGDKEATEELNLGHKYGIKDVDFDPTSGCSIAINQERIYFDYLGRPFYGNPRLQTTAYQNSRMIKTQCRIKLCMKNPCSAASGSDVITIAIEPETGYAHIL